MCSRVKCHSCNKPTYAGCGAHIEQVLGDVAPKDRCRCREEKTAAAPQKGTTGGFWKTLFGMPGE